MNQSLQHDAAWACSHSVVDVFAPLLREEEQRDAFAEVYARLMAMLEVYDIQLNRMWQRLHPTRN